MNGTLYISKATEADEGKYICEADNGVNEPIGKMVHLKINGKYLHFCLQRITSKENRPEKQFAWKTRRYILHFTK